jgi:hypothetical protein
LLEERVARHVLSCGMAQLAMERGARRARRGLMASMFFLFNK